MTPKTLSEDLMGLSGGCLSLSQVLRLKTTQFVTDYIAYNFRVSILGTGNL